ncbi:unnamed protein product, partial [Phaeothamnion confervicola]
RDGGGGGGCGFGGGAAGTGGCGGGDGSGGGAATADDGRGLFELLRVLGAAMQHLAHYRSRKCVETLHRLQPRQFNTGWVQCAIGRALFEAGDYAGAKQAFQLMMQWEPHRMEGLEVLSTVLWHLHDDVELCYLAQHAVQRDRLSPVTWCVLGNCFSLQREHETALKFFKRAIQLDRGMAYASTLCGHEHVANEDFDKATACYRAAIAVDHRHYHAC